jgi:hypothetical protein
MAHSFVYSIIKYQETKPHVGKYLENYSSFKNHQNITKLFNLLKPTGYVMHQQV